MKKRYSEEQIVRILQEGTKSGSVKETSRRHGISEPTFYAWRKKYAGMEITGVRKLRSLEEENRKLKKLLANMMLDNDALKALLEKYGEAR